MKLDYSNDAYKDERYPDYVDRKKRELVGYEMGILVLKIVYQVFKVLIIYSPLLYLGFRLTENSFGKILGEYPRTGLIILIAFIFYTLVYFAKGVVIGLKQQSHKFWLAAWSLCVLITCVLPAFFVRGILETFVDPANRSLPLYQALTWIGAIIFSFYTYSAYKFRTPVAPKIVYWSYALGIKMSK